MRAWAAAGILAVLFAVQAAAETAGDMDAQATYCLGQAEFSQQFAAGFAAAGPLSAHDRDVTQAVAKRLEVLSAYLTRRGVDLGQPPARESRARGSEDQSNCVLDRMAKRDAARPGDPGLCAVEVTCDTLLHSLPQ